MLQQIIKSAYNQVNKYLYVLYNVDITSIDALMSLIYANLSYQLLI
jgi:hypothetical protein